MPTRKLANQQGIATAWASGRGGFNELRLDAPHLDGYLTLTLDLVFLGVASLNRISIGGYLRHLRRFVANTWGLMLIEIISK